MSAPSLEAIIGSGQSRGKSLCRRCGEKPYAVNIAVQIRDAARRSRYRSTSVCEDCAVILWNDLTERLP